jgi:rubrerythrin
MTEIEQFIAAAIRLERNSALRYDELADAISGLGAPEVVKFFRLQALMSRRHMQQAQAWSAFRETWDGTDQAESPNAASPDDAVNPAYDFPDDEPPENTPIWVADGFVALKDAMAIALQTEESAYAYYAQAAATSGDPEVRRMAAEFAVEETGHANMVKAMMSRIKEN